MDHFVKKKIYFKGVEVVLGLKLSQATRVTRLGYF